MSEKLPGATRRQRGYLRPQRLYCACISARHRRTSRLVKRKPIGTNGLLFLRQMFCFDSMNSRRFHEWRNSGILRFVKAREHLKKKKKKIILGAEENSKCHRGFMQHMPEIAQIMQPMKSKPECRRLACTDRAARHLARLRTIDKRAGKKIVKPSTAFFFF